jgi:transcriptional regulator with XRE-family HTH domain
MSIHSTFAANLRSKSFEHGTIADICRGIGINRQQFNKYLAGTSIPNAMTLRKICGFLEIDEHTLFIDTASPMAQALNTPLLHRRRPMGLNYLDKRHYDLEVDDVPSGFYSVFMPLPAVSGFLVRSLIFVFRQGKRKEFVRLTRFSNETDHKKTLISGRHSGIVFANNVEIYFLGFNRYPPYQCSLTVLQRGNGSSVDFYDGTITTHGFGGPLNSRICLRYLSENIDVRAAISDLGHVHETNSGLGIVASSRLHRSHSETA